MTSQTSIIGGMILLAVGTYLIRYAGFSIGARFPFSDKYQELLSGGATTLLCAIAVMTTLFEGQHFAGFARLIGVGIAILLVWKRVPLLLIMLSAAGITAALRYLGMS
ncbi:AzlD domain-containing protein [Acinetobacter sp. MB5]|uniref:AzlD domain-containing protein n=1 Tax=Acinetobacter sp. MB5 TaxID=2069438 RepID=UPI000DD0682C|nr:AzlD domain-containing protein [Acinetobacter sp. MB5]